MANDAGGPLAGVRVLDASRVLAGPFCGQMLGDLGAEVLKVERPGQGDETRAWGPPFSGEFSAYYLSCNRNKKGLTLDLAKPEGLEIFYRLVEKSDVLLENFRSASADRLGLSPARLQARNPRLIVCSISGFGRTGPWSDLPGYDFAIQGLSGLMDITGPVEGPPSKVGVAASDVLTGLYAGVAILACLHARHTTGHGYAIDLALLDCAVASQVNLVQAYLTSGAVPKRQGNAHLQIVPYQAFQTADAWLIVAIGNDGQWQRFCDVAGRQDWAGDSRFATNTARVHNRQALVPLLEELMRAQSTLFWQEKLHEAEVPHAPVLDYAQLFAQPQAAARGLRMTVHDPSGNPFDLVGTPFHIERAALPRATMPPKLGQDTDMILQEVLGLDAKRCAELRARRNLELAANTGHATVPIELLQTIFFEIWDFEIVCYLCFGFCVLGRSLPMPRIVSLIASATEIACALGMEDHLVGRSHECDFPPSVQRLPVCTEPKFDVHGSSRQIDDRVKAVLQDAASVYRVDADMLRELRPDVILTQTQCEVCAVSARDVDSALASWLESRPQVVSLQPNALADVWDDIGRVARALGVAERGANVVRALHDRMAALAARARGLADKPTVACLEWIDPLMAAGNWMPELVDMAGGVNLFGEAGRHSPWMTWTDLTRRDPDVIVARPCGFDLNRTRVEMAALPGYPGWHELKAVAAGRVFVTDGNQYFNRPGPRLVDSLEILAEILHPEAFRFGHEGSGWQKF